MARDRGDKITLPPSVPPFDHFHRFAGAFYAFDASSSSPAPPSTPSSRDGARVLPYACLRTILTLASPYLPFPYLPSRLRLFRQPPPPPYASAPLTSSSSSSSSLHLLWLSLFFSLSFFRLISFLFFLSPSRLVSSPCSLAPSLYPVRRPPRVRGSRSVLLLLLPCLVFNPPAWHGKTRRLVARLVARRRCRVCLLRSGACLCVSPTFRRPASGSPGVAMCSPVSRNMARVLGTAQDHCIKRMMTHDDSAVPHPSRIRPRDDVELGTWGRSGSLGTGGDNLIRFPLPSPSRLSSLLICAISLSRVPLSLSPSSFTSLASARTTTEDKD
jgi:hypothetical protein